jgi:hypothetical protein
MPPDELVLEDGLAGGRRRLRLRIGAIAVEATEVPGPSLTDSEWQDILLARTSYRAMWGDDPAMMDDPQDGREDGVYDTRHYVAWVRDRVDEGVAAAEGARPAKLVAMRKVRLVGTRLAAAQRADPNDLLPTDIRYWRARTRAADVPLWDLLKAHARQLLPGDDLAEFRVAAIGRIGTFPYGETRIDHRQRERTAIGLAAIALLAAHDDPNLYWVWTLCSELRDRVLGIADLHGGYVAPCFPPTAQVLGVDADALYMDDDLAIVQAHKVGQPGYFIHTEDAAQILTKLLDQQQLTIGDLGAAFTHMLITEPHERGIAHLERLVRLLSARDHRGLAELLTQPRLFKYLSPLLAGEEPLSRMSSADFRARLLRDTRDRPFAAMVRPGPWTTSVRAVLSAAAAKYGNGEMPARILRPRRRAAEAAARS